jgi:glycosyltransferase involved in cell wall biosynthesis
MSLTKQHDGTAVRASTSLDVHVVSVMGLEQSGLSIASGRYAEALRTANVASKSIIVGQTDYPEHGNSHRVATTQSLVELLLSSYTSRTVCMWVGLHTTPTMYLEQLQAIRILAAKGIVNVVVPERTEMPHRSAYSAFEAIVAEGCVSGLVHLNDIQSATWSGRVEIPAVVAPPPIPDALFARGRVRLDTICPTGHPTIVFVGRLTRRKGADWLVQAWPGLRKELMLSGVDVNLCVFGRPFHKESEIAERFARMQGQAELGLRWQSRFLAEDDIPSLSDRAVGISLSDQEFDGIAASELLALGLPVIATPTAGLGALSKESGAILLRPTRRACVEEATHLLEDDAARQTLSARAHSDMWKRRSLAVVGEQLRRYLFSI